MTTDLEIIEFTELVSDLLPPCDYDRLFRCGPATAEWALFARCGCGHTGERLTCAGCKDKILAVEDGLKCPSDCGEVFIPARKAFARMEKL